MIQPKKVFIGSAPEDDQALTELIVFLRPLVHSGRVSIWTEREISAGYSVKNETIKAIKEADLILFLISANFFASDYLDIIEASGVFQLDENKPKRIVPIIIRPCMWEEFFPLRSLQVLPRGGRPIYQYENIQLSWTEVATNIVALVDSLNQKEITGEDVLFEAKIILLGDGRSGKTSLAHRLLGKSLPTEADRTLGVDIVIGNYEFPIANNRKFKLNIFDFAGQDKYKPLHQFFYTESSLYIMVAESGNARTDFDDWLQTAELFGEGSPLLIVLNEFRDGIGFGSFDREIWQKRFPNLLKDVFSVNLGTKRGFDELEHSIQLLAQSLPHTRHPYPKNWADIRRALESRRDENFITLQEYLEICEKNELPEEESALILSQVLNKIGVFLHYQKSDLLKQFVILKNEWATGAVYKILDDAIVAETKKGFFDRSDLERIWSGKDYRHMRPQLLELMQQFKMAYPLPGNQQFVTPPLLPAGPPEDWKWPETDALEIFIDYEFLPKALLTQFIVTRHNDIDQGKTLVWRNGVVLRWPDEALGEILKTKLQGKDAFYIRTSGRDQKGLMTVILKTFRELHDEYRGIKSEEKVPCPCEGCRSSKNKQHYFKFEYLKRRVEKGFFEEFCAESESFETINSLKLLENHFVFEKIQVGQPLFLKRDVGENRKNEAQKSGPLKVFISYSKHDREKFLVPMTRYLNPLMRGGLLEFWDDSKILPGEEWDEKIKSEIEKSDVIFLLVSTHSLNTEYIWNVEVEAAMRRHEDGTARVIPLVLSKCLWTEKDRAGNYIFPPAKLNGLPAKGKPIDKWEDENDAWDAVAEGVKAILKEIS